MVASIGVYRADYQGWDACWIEHGPLTLILVPQVGGRIMGKRWCGHDLAFVNAELAGHVEDVATVGDVRRRKRELGLLLWGGDKTWLAPQDRWTEEAPFLDLDSGEYHLDVEEADADTLVARMQSPVCRETGVQINRTLTVSALTPGQWTLEHELRNPAAQVVEWAPWDVDMLRRPAQVFLPKRADSAYPDGVKTYANEGESLTIRDQVVSHHGPVVTVECTAAQRFKFGVDAELGAVLAVLDVPGLGLVGYRKHVPTFHPQPYGHGCVAEVLTRRAMII